MPINLSHAYGNGRVYSHKSNILLRLIARIMYRATDILKSNLVWDVYEKNSVLGKNCFLGTNAWCSNMGAKGSVIIGNNVYCKGLLRTGTIGGGKITIGDEVYIGDDTIISSEACIEIGSQTMVSHGVHIFDTVGHPTDPDLRMLDWKIIIGKEIKERPPASSSKIIIGKNVWIGFNATIMRGVTIGDNSIVAAGSVVVSNVEANTIVAGNPAHLVKNIVSLAGDN